MSLFPQFTARLSSVVEDGNDVVAFGRNLVVRTNFTLGLTASLQVYGRSWYRRLVHRSLSVVSVTAPAAVFVGECRTRVGSSEIALTVKQEVVRQVTCHPLIHVGITASANNILAVIAEAANPNESTL